MKKVLLITGSLNIGGIEKLTVDYSSFIDKQKYQLHYLVFGEHKHFYEDIVLKNGAKVHKSPYPKTRISLYYTIKKAIREFGPFDIVHSHILFSSGLAMRAAYKESVKVRIAHSHDNLSYTNSSIVKKIYQFIMRRYLLKYSTKIVACSNDAGVYLFGKTFEDKGIVLKNKINVNKFRYNKSNRIRVRSAYNIKDNDILIGNIGRVEAQKNQKFIVEIVSKLQLEKNTNAKAIIVGDGTRIEQLQDYIDENNMTESVILAGKTGNPEEYLSAFDCFVLPSIHEGFGIVLIEAQANGLPCFAPKYIIPEEAKVTKNFTFIKNNNDADEWAVRIKKMSNRINSDKTIELLKANDFDLENLSNDLTSLYSIDRKTQL